MEEGEGTAVRMPNALLTAMVMLWISVLGSAFSVLADITFLRPYAREKAVPPSQLTALRWMDLATASITAVLIVLLLYVNSRRRWVLLGVVALEAMNLILDLAGPWIIDFPTLAKRLEISAGTGTAYTVGSAVYSLIVIVLLLHPETRRFLSREEDPRA